jgi:hypothetical protein
MDGIQWLFIGINDKNVTQVFAPLRASGFPGNGGLDKVRKRFLVASTSTNPCNLV